MPSEPFIDAKEQVRQAVDIVDLVGRHITLRRQGRMYVGLCPWHDDSRPSLQVNPERQTWRCWVCNDGGDVFSFVMKHDGVEFREALEMLAEKAGVVLTSAPAAGPSQGEKKLLYDVMAWAQQQYHQLLQKSPQAAPAREYCRRRQIDEDSITRFHLGFAPGEWQWLLQRAQQSGHKLDLLEATGLIGRGQNGRRYDFFRGRLMFPIRDVQGRTIAFGGRVLPEFDHHSKYLNIKDTRLFQKSQQLYGLDIAGEVMRKSRQAILMEGYTDVVMAHQFGVREAVAVLGTSVTAEHIRARSVLRRYADRITLVLDGDAAGQNRTTDLLALFLAEQVDLRVLTLPQGMDPCDYLLQYGGDKFREIVNAAPDVLDFTVAIHSQNVDVEGDTHGANLALEQILNTLAAAPRDDQVDASTRLRRQQILSRLSRRFHVAEDDIRARLTELRRRRQRAPRKTPNESAHAHPARPQSPHQQEQPTSAQPEAGSTSNRAMSAVDTELLELLAHHPELASSAVQQIAIERLQPGPARRLYMRYCQCVEAGETADFRRIMSSLEDPDLKRLLVELDERGAAKESLSLADPQTRLAQIVGCYEKERHKRRYREITAALADPSGDQSQQTDFLSEIIEKQREKHVNQENTD